MARLLVIDDEKAILDLVKNGLEKDGHIVTVCESVADVTISALKNYDLILLDIMLPDVDGFMFCKKIRGIVDCPILFLTAKVMETDIIYGLGIGADDYITKPFRIGELRARVTAHLRRERREHHNTLGFEQEIKFDLSSKEFFIKGKKVDLTKSEYEICEYLARNRGQVFTREQIYEAVFGFDGNSDNSTIATHIKNIRSKLAGYGVTPINTVWGVGYRWEG